MVNHIAPLIVLVHLTRTLGVELYGIVAFSTGITLFGLVLIDFGYALSATNKIALNRKNKKYVAGLVGAIIKIKILIFLVGFVVLAVFAFNSSKYADHKSIILLSAFPILTQGLLPIWFFQGIEKLKHVAIYSIASKFTFMMLVIVLVTNKKTYWLVPMLNGISQFIALILALIFLYRLGYEVDFKNKKMMRYALRINKGFFLSRISVAAYIQAGPVLLGLVSSPMTVGIYTVAEQLYKAMQTAISPVAQAVYPYMAKEKNIMLYKKISLTLIGGIFLCSGIGAIIAPYILTWLFGSEWSSSIEVLNVFLIAIIIHACSVLAGYPICAAVNRLQVANQSVVMGALVYFALFTLLWALDLLSPVNMAILMMATEFYVFSHRYIGVRSALLDI